VADPALEARVAALEQRTITVPDLPMRALLHKLEQNWQPDAATLLQGGSLTVDLLTAALKFGVGTITWPGGSPRSSNLTVTHGLGRTPTSVLIVANTGVGGSGTVFPVYAALSLTTTTFVSTAVTSNESNPAAAASAGFYWLAI